MSARALCALLLLAAAPAAAEDAEGCRDHPLFNRLPAYALAGCETKEFDATRMPLTPGCEARTETLEGEWFSFDYRVRDGAKPASALQIQRNFITAIQQAGGTVVAAGADYGMDGTLCFDGAEIDRGAVLKLNKGGSEVWTAVKPFDAGEGYELIVLQRQAMKQDIAANELLDKISRDGFVALYLNFDTAKASLKPDSLPVLDQVAAMLKSAPALKLEVAGHTDNVGDAAANQTLSEDRARSVVNALTQRGIDGQRLVAKGYGQTTPLADNRSEDGRARNRRVELVKR